MEEKCCENRVKFRRFSVDVDLHEESRLVVQQQITKSASLLCRPTLLCTRMALLGNSFYQMAYLSTYSHLSLQEVKVDAGKYKGPRRELNWAMSVVGICLWPW